MQKAQGQSEDVWRGDVMVHDVGDEGAVRGKEEPSEIWAVSLYLFLQSKMAYIRRRC
jgi:hypothetical protein